MDESAALQVVVKTGGREPGHFLVPSDPSGPWPSHRGPESRVRYLRAARNWRSVSAIRDWAIRSSL